MAYRGRRQDIRLICTYAKKHRELEKMSYNERQRHVWDRKRGQIPGMHGVRDRQRNKKEAGKLPKDSDRLMRRDNRDRRTDTNFPVGK